jgi:membrane protein
VRAVIKNAKSNPGFGTAATLLFSVPGVFGQLQYALDEIFDVRAGEGSAGMHGWLRKRLLSLGTFLSVAFLLVVSLVASALVSAAAESSRDLLPGADVVWQAVAFGLSLLLTTLVFSLIFEVLPDAPRPVGERSLFPSSAKSLHGQLPICLL